MKNITVFNFSKVKGLTDSKRYFNKIVWSVFRFLLMLGLSFLIIYPIFSVLANSFKSFEDMLDVTVYYIPRNPTLGNYIYVWKSIKYSLTLLNNIGLSFLVALLQTISCTMVGYGLARYKFPLRGLVFTLSIITLVIPPQTILIPLYIRFRFFSFTNLFSFTGLMEGVSLINQVWPFLMLSATAVAFKSGLFIYLLRQFFINIPSALEEAAYIDGCGGMKTFIKIMVPNAIPMLVTVFLFSFVWQWNDYYHYIMLGRKLPTIGMKILDFMIDRQFVQDSTTQILSSSPSFILIILPLLILYIFTQRYFVESISKSGIVG